MAGSWQPLQLGDSQRPAAEHGPRDLEPSLEPKSLVASRGGHCSAQREHPQGLPSRSSGSAWPEQVTEMLRNVVCVKKYFVKLV